MLKRLIALHALVIALSSVVSVKAQTMRTRADEMLDFSAVEAYFVLSDQLAQHIEPLGKEWTMFFEAPINSLMISANAFDSIKFANDLRRTYSAEDSKALTNDDDKALQHHLKYKDYAAELKSHIQFLKTSSVTDSIFKYVRSYLPDRLFSINDIPKQYYIFYGSEDATGGIDMVINDLYLSYKIDRYRVGLLSAHETFHSIVSKAFANQLVNVTAADQSNIGFLYFLSNISQEGVADLIDKPLLLKSESPLKDEVNKLMTDELALTTQYLIKLEGLLKNAKGTLSQNFNDLSMNYSKHGGHIPGRLMGKVIKDYGLLSNLVEKIEDPVVFFEVYNEAVKKGKVQLPTFSKESLRYLDKLRLQYYK